MSYHPAVHYESGNPSLCGNVKQKLPKNRASPANDLYDRFEKYYQLCVGSMPVNIQYLQSSTNGGIG
ncbi:MAG TPA: hypothetical protein VKP61_14050 [Candidatus Acidoferrum sp.]|nr:hypothetical protein [Candidatus Acidoferrum sp.]